MVPIHTTVVIATITTSREAGPMSMRTRLVALVVLVGLSTAWLVMRRGGDDPRTDTGLVAYVDPAAGFAIGHPAGWSVDRVPDGVTFTAAGRNAVSVRRSPLAHPVDPRNVAELRAVTDAVLSAPAAHLDVLNATPTTVDGRPGVFYLYTFPAAGGRGAHTHYFVFDRAAMYSIVFQALPDSGFAALARTFDAMVSSFRVTAA
jgi:hypothetical protein